MRHWLQKFRPFLILCIGGALIACSHLHPAHNQLTPHNRCLALQKKILFVKANKTNQPHSSIQKTRDQLEHQYFLLGCHKITN